MWKLATFFVYIIQYFCNKPGQISPQLQAQQILEAQYIYLKGSL